MATLQEHHQLLKEHLEASRWEDAQALWLELATELADQLEFLLLLVKEFADAGNPAMAAELVSLIAPGLRTAGKLHEWLYALKLQAGERPKDKALRAEVRDAYLLIYEADPRLKTIVAAAGLDEAAVPLPAAVARADTLLALAPGAYCRHKSWGFGRIKSFDTTLQRILVEFPHNPEHAMQLAYAAESVTPVSAENIEVRKVSDLKGLQQLAADDPVALVRLVLVGFDRAATAIQIESALAGSVIPADQWKKWWDHARKLLRRDPHFECPARKTDFVRLRPAPVSQQDELLEAFRQANGLRQQIAVAGQLLRAADGMADPELLLQEFQDALIAAVRQSRPSQMVDRVEAALLIDQLRARQRTPASEPSLVAGLLDAAGDLPDLLDQLSLASQKQLVGLLKTTQPDRLRVNLNRFPARVLDDMADLIPPMADQVVQLVRNQTASLELLYWLSRSMMAAGTATWMDRLPGALVLAAMLNGIEMAPNRSVTKKLRDLMLNEETLLTDLLAEASADTIRDAARQVLASTAVEELERRSLMGRLVKGFPFIQELLVSRVAGAQPLVVSWASYEKRKAELDDIVQKKIPQNSREIGQARSYGDLSENFEFKAAKDAQRILQRRRAELELLLARAQPSQFADVRTDTVQIGTSVTVTDLASGQPQTFHVLGAWDSDPQRNIISYPAALAQSFLYKPAGETVEAKGDAGPIRYRIDRIEKVPAEILQAL